MRVIGAWLVHWFEWLLLGVGLGCLGSYAYEVVEARRFQAEQAAAFALVSAVPASEVPAIQAGALVGMLDVPRLKLTTAVIEGDDDTALKRAAGHLPDTPLPWQEGNSAIAGHRDGLFRPLKNVAVGDEILFRTGREELRYRVSATTIVEPDDLSVLAPRSTAALTLITCYPFHYIGPAPKRFVIHAERLAPGAPAR